MRRRPAADRPPVPGHQCFGYSGDGTYRCECGFLVSASKPLAYDEDDAGGPTVKALNDQWEAHREEVRQQQHQQ